MVNTPVTRYSALGQALHWLTAILVLIAFIYGPGGSEQRVYAASRDFDRQLHETLGLTVFALALLRVLWRLGAARPEPAPAAPAVAWVAKAVQAGLYLLLFAVPVTAIAGAWLEGHPLTLAAGTTVGPWLAESHALGARIAALHTWLGDAILWLAGVHAAAAIYHHLVLKDDVLASMAPRWALRGGRGAP
jgi:cytochrome b561